MLIRDSPFWQLRHPWRHGKLSIPLASALFHSICPLSLNLLISTSLPYFVREAISEIYMKRQFAPLPFFPLTLTLHWDQTDLKNGVCTLMKFAPHHIGCYSSDGSRLCLYLLVLCVTNGQSWQKSHRRWCGVVWCGVPPPHPHPFNQRLGASAGSQLRDCSSTLMYWS